MNSIKLFLVIFFSFLITSCGGGGGGGYGSGGGSTNHHIGGSIQGKPLYLAPTVSTFAGMTLTTGSTDATGTMAKFNFPNAITTDGTNLYVVDDSNNVIRQIVIATGAVTTLAGSGVASSTDGTGTLATFNFSGAGNTNGITTDGTNLYVAENFSAIIRKIVIATGVVTTIAGTSGVFGNKDASGTAATFSNPFGITTDGTNLYVVDNTNCNVRKIVIATNAVTTFAGTAFSCGAQDGGATATFKFPTDITTDGTNLYVVDNGNNQIRQIVIATGMVSSLAGVTNTPATPGGAVDGAGAVATFNSPSGITTDGTNLYVTDTGNNKIRKIVIATGVVSSLTGTLGMPVTAGAVDGAGVSASFNFPYGITTDGTSLYVADQNNSTIRKIR